MEGGPTSICFLSSSSSASVALTVSSLLRAATWSAFSLSDCSDDERGRGTSTEKERSRERELVSGVQSYVSKGEVSAGSRARI